MKVVRSTNIVFVVLSLFGLLQGCSKEESAPPATTSTTTQPAPTTPPTTPNATPPTAVQPAGVTASTDGATIYRTYCQTCHGDKGEGNGPAAVGLDPKPANFATHAFKYDANGNGTKGDLEDIEAIVRDGAAKYGGSPLMVPWTMLSDEQRKAVATYVKSLGG